MTEEHDLAEARVREAFRKVRNRLRKHYPEEIISACIKKLNEHPSDRLQHLRNYPPWRLLMLVKWTLIYGEYLSPKRRPLKLRDFHYILNRMRDLEGCQRSPNEYDNVFLFFRNFAFQQFWLQHPISLSHLARQSLLFDRLNREHPFQKGFKEKCGISIHEFIELALMLMTRFIVEKQISVTTDWFKVVADNYEPDTIQKFLDLLSGDIESLKNKLAQEEPSGRKISYEYYEQTPLRNTPLLKWSGKYYPFSRELLARSLETFVYDTLRSNDPNYFMNKFGPIFERYVGNSISNMSIPFFEEGDLKEILSGSGKVIDYLLLERGSSIFIDAKGVEMSYLGMVSHRAEVIKHQTRNSIIKGIEQGFECAIRLDGIDKLKNIPVGKEKYLIIVTFKDLYIGNGRVFYSYEKDALDRIVMKHENTPPIPFKNMYFISIDDFDRLAEAIASGKVGLPKILERAVTDDSVNKTMKFSFGQHLQSICPEVQPPKWLKEESQKILDCCAKRFKNKEASNAAG